MLELVDRDLYCRNRPLLGKFGSFGERGTNANGLGYGSEYCLERTPPSRDPIRPLVFHIYSSGLILCSSGFKTIDCRPLK